MGCDHEWPDAVAAADLHRHHGVEPAARVELHEPCGTGNGLMVGQPLDADERRAHVGDDADPVVVTEVRGRHELDATALAKEHPHIEHRQIGIAAAAGAQNPGADGERFDIVLGDVPSAQANILLNSMS